MIRPIGKQIYRNHFAFIQKPEFDIHKNDITAE